MARSNSVRNRSRFRFFLFIGIFIVFLVAGVSFFSNRGFFSLQIFDVTQDLLSLWNEEEFTALYDTSKAILDEDPFNRSALQFYGYAAFMLGYWQVDHVEKERLLWESIVTLRRVMLLTKKSSSDHVYMLGRAYFHLQEYDRSLLYLEQAHLLGVRSKNLDEYLISLYDVTENGEKLSQLVKERPQEDDIYRYAFARSLMLTDATRQAIEAFVLFIAKSDDVLLRRLGSIHLARLYYAEEALEQAERILLELVDNNQFDTDALELLGDVYKASENDEAARYYWREVLRLEPDNAVVIYKLNGV